MYRSWKQNYKKHQYIHLLDALPVDRCLQYICVCIIHLAFKLFKQWGFHFFLWETLSMSLCLTTGFHSLKFSHSFGVGSYFGRLHYLDAHLVSLGSWPVMGASDYSVLTPSGQLRVTEMTPACAVPLEDFLARLQRYVCHSGSYHSRKNVDYN